MARNLLKLFGSAVEFETFGKSSLAYMRRMSQSDMNTYFPDAEDWYIGADTTANDVWGLFGADGEPLAFSNEKSFLTQNAEEMDLLTVRIQ